MPEPSLKGLMDAMSIDGQETPLDFPLLQLPGPALEVLVALLPASARCSLRLCSSAAAAAIDAHTTRLMITQEGPFKPLQHRFPRLAQLRLEDPGLSDVRDAAAWQPFSGIMQQEQWAGVTSLHLLYVPPVVAREAISCCPNAAVCVARAAMRDHREQEYPGAQLSQHISSSLRGLTSLLFCVPHHSLGDEDLQQLTRSCPSLAVLDSSPLQCSVAGLEALCSMRLRSLTTSFDGVHCHLPVDALSSLGRLTQLTLLYLTGGEEEQWAAILLPTSLVTLELNRGLPPTVKQPFPHLAKLDIRSCRLSDGIMALLAARCPALALLGVGAVDLTEACHATPLPGLASLATISHCTATAGMRFNRAFPKLQVLKLTGDHTLAAGFATFEGAVLLETLDIGCFFHPHDHACSDVSHCAHVQASDFAALASLRSLKHLRLDATPDHVQGVGAHLPFLHSITWTCGMKVFEFLDTMKAAFGSLPAPQQLRTARFEFTDEEFEEDGDEVVIDFGMLDSLEEWPPSEDAFNAHLNGQALAQVANSAVAWLLSAPLLARVEWMEDEAGCACWSDAYICAVAAHSTVTHITLSHIGSITPSMLERVRELHASRGLEVVIGYAALYAVP